MDLMLTLVEGDGACKCVLILSGTFCLVCTFVHVQYVMYMSNMLLTALLLAIGPLQVLVYPLSAPPSLQSQCFLMGYR